MKIIDGQFHNKILFNKVLKTNTNKNIAKENPSGNEKLKG